MGRRRSVALTALLPRLRLQSATCAPVRLACACAGLRPRASLGPCCAGGAGAGEDGPYFLEQTVSNACGTVALVHAYAALATAGGGGTEAEGWLGGFVSRTGGMTSVERAAALEEDEALAVSHNDMARQVTSHSPCVACKAARRVDPTRMATRFTPASASAALRRQCCQRESLPPSLPRPPASAVLRRQLPHLRP